MTGWPCSALQFCFQSMGAGAAYDALEEAVTFSGTYLVADMTLHETK